jgi:DNA (cytosine-5)-methyltransferase 1
MKIFYIDLFSGAGGTTTGIHFSNYDLEVIACVNHDANAIESHKANHPNCLHFTEDIRDMKVVIALKNMVNKLRIKYPDCIINIWASLECTNYSKAKGGLPRDADSRTLAYSLYAYIEELMPDYIFIENVTEFMSWGPLDENGKPINRYNGKDYIKWIDKMKSYGYGYDWKVLNSANFGAYTSRQRYFGQFAKKGLTIKWPEATHAKKINGPSLFNHAHELWKPVRDILDLTDEGTSIFNRKKPLVENTLKRIYAGLVKFIANGDSQFIYRYNGGDEFEKAKSIQAPIGAIATSNRHCVVKASFLTSYYGNGNGIHEIENPSPTITTRDRLALNNICFIDNQYGNSKLTETNKPINTITGNPKQNLVTIKQNFLLNPQYASKGGSIDKPCFTLIARMDKMPPYLVEAEGGIPKIKIDKHDFGTIVSIKWFMIHHGIIDIKMRMLKIKELLKIQGFPEDYILKGTKKEQLKYIGNSVEINTAKAIVNANAENLILRFKEAI